MRCVFRFLIASFLSRRFINGSKDDPIGEINSIFDAANGFGVGQHEDRSSGPLAGDARSAQNSDSNDSYRLHYRVEELPWPSQQNSSA